MRSIIILSFIAVLSSCNQQASTDQGTESTTAAPATEAEKAEVPVEMIDNPATASNPNAQPGELPVMTFRKTDHDFGDIIENQVVETTYEFTNTGKSDLLISDCKAACGCTVPNWPREPIKPGKGGKITVKFDSAGKSGVNNKIVTVLANTKEGSTELKFRANVQAVKKEEAK